MKNFICCLVLALSFSVHGAISIVSDLDDTIKISTSDGDMSDYFGDDLFTGMIEFFKGSKTYTNELHILSASPNFMRARIKSLLKKKGIVYHNLVLKRSFSEDKYDYKVEALKEILNASSDDFIFIGDDLGKDPEAYAAIKKLYPDRVLAIYIHRIKARSITLEAIPYYTSFDLFMREHLAGRMIPGWIEFAIDRMLKETNMEMIFPKEAQCPTNHLVWEWQLASMYMQESRAITKKLTTFCLQRRSGNNLP
jgi:hypothetical protein